MYSNSLDSDYLRSRRDLQNCSVAYPEFHVVFWTLVWNIAFEFFPALVLLEYTATYGEGLDELIVLAVGLDVAAADYYLDLSPAIALL